MGLIFRYLAKETYVTLIAVTSILVLIFMSHQFVHYLGDAAGGRLTPQAVFQMMCIQVPLLLGFLIPLGFFLGILLTFGRLYIDNEMTVLTACGLSKGQILAKSMIIALVIFFFVSILMLWIEPKMAWYRDRIIAKAIASSPIEKVSPGRFQQVGNWVFYTEAITRDRQKMQHVFAAALPAKKDPEQNAKIDVVIAQKAYQKISPLKEIFMVLDHGYRYMGTPGSSNYQIVKFNEYGVRLPDKELTSNKLEEFMSFKELWLQQHTNLKAAAELQWRIAMPLSVIILTLFAVPLSEVKLRQGRFAQLLPAIIIYIVYLDLLFLGRAWIEKGKLSSYIGLWWIHGIMLLLASLILLLKWSSFFSRKR